MSSVHFEWMTALFFVVYMLMVHIVLLNVAVAVLLEVGRTRSRQDT